VGKDLRLSAAAVRRHMTGNTAIVVASAPGFPHGVVDHIEDIAKLCRCACGGRVCA
jgi:sphinganine-1-phosphate aldolase